LDKQERFSSERRGLSYWKNEAERKKMNLGGRPVSETGWINKKDFRRNAEDFHTGRTRLKERK